MCKAFSRPQRQLQAITQIEECDGAILELFTDYSICRQPQPVPIEADSPFKVIYTKGDNGNSWCQCSTLLNH